MYKFMMNGEEYQREAKGLSIDAGNLFFYCDEACTLIDCVVSAGNWQKLEIDGDSSALQIRAAAETSIQPEAGSGEEVIEASEEKIHCTEVGVEECAKAKEA